MPTFDLDLLDPKKRHGMLLGAIGPRPIALVATVNAEGGLNVSPFSFFNIFSTTPPIVVFSPSRRVRDNTTKDTLDNVLQVRECTVNMVSYDLAHQVNLSSAEYPSHIDEFKKAGFTPVPSQTISVPYVKESPVSLECEVREVVALGESGGSGNLVICEVKMMHVKDEVLDEDGLLNQESLDLVGRMGRNWWTRSSGESLFTLGAPTAGIGVDQLPAAIRRSTVLTGNNIAQLAGVLHLPEQAEVDKKSNEFEIKRLLQNSPDALERREALHELAKSLLDDGQVEEAWKVLLIDKGVHN